MTPFRETELLNAATARLREMTGLDITQRAPERGPGPRPEGRIEIAQGGHTWAFQVACKAVIDRVAKLHRST
jgi:hypothetical protein